MFRGFQEAQDRSPALRARRALIGDETGESLRGVFARELGRDPDDPAMRALTVMVSAALELRDKTLPRRDPATGSPPARSAGGCRGRRRELRPPRDGLRRRRPRRPSRRAPPAAAARGRSASGMPSQSPTSWPAAPRRCRRRRRATAPPTGARRVEPVRGVAEAGDRLGEDREHDRQHVGEHDRRGRAHQREADRERAEHPERLEQRAGGELAERRFQASAPGEISVPITPSRRQLSEITSAKTTHGERLRRDHALALGHERERRERGPLRPLAGHDEDGQHRREQAR